MDQTPIDAGSMDPKGTHAHRFVPPPTSLFSSFRLVVRFALREMRGGLSGFYIFLACIALGVAAIGAVGSASRTLTGGLEERGREILGADIALSSTNRAFDGEEKALFASLGAVSEIASLRAMARTDDASAQMLVEIKAVDGLYPMVGGLADKGWWSPRPQGGAG